MIRIFLLILLSVLLFLLVGFLTGSVVHRGPHDWYHLPGVTVEYYQGHGLKVEAVKPWVLTPLLAAAYAIVYFLFGYARGRDEHESA